MGDKDLIPLELRFLHDPDATEGFVGATLSSNVLRFSRKRLVYSECGLYMLHVIYLCVIFK